MFTPEVIGETTRGLGWDMSSAYSRTLGSFFPMGVGRAHRLHRPLDLDGSGEPGLRDHPDQPRAPVRQGQRGGAAPARQRRRGRVSSRRRASRRRRPPSTEVGATPPTDEAGRADPDRPRSTRGRGLRAAARPVRRPRDEPDGDRRAGAARDRSAGGRARRHAPRGLLARARARRSARCRRCPTGAMRRPDCPCGASTARRVGLSRDARRRRHARLRHPGRRRALLHVSHDARVRAGGGGRRRIPVVVLDRPNPITGRDRRGAGDGPRPALLHGAAPDSGSSRA